MTANLKGVGAEWQRGLHDEELLEVYEDLREVRRLLKKCRGLLNDPDFSADIAPFLVNALENWPWKIETELRDRKTFRSTTPATMGHRK